MQAGGIGVIDSRKKRAPVLQGAEIDRVAAEATSIETLRAAAREAGIADASFEAALREYRESSELPARAPARVPRSRRLLHAVAGVGGAGLLFFWLVLLGRFIA